MRESMQLLLDIIQAPDADTLERFLGRLPLVSKVAILSPHGYFGQTNVLGKPDTGGQVMMCIYFVYSFKFWSLFILLICLETYFWGA